MATAASPGAVHVTRRASPTLAAGLWGTPTGARLLYQQQAAHTHMASGTAWSVVSGGDAVGASRHFFSRAPEVHPRRWCTRTTRLGRLCRGSRARAHDAKWTRDRRCRRTSDRCRRTSGQVPQTVSYVPQNVSESQAVVSFLKCTYTGISLRAPARWRCIHCTTHSNRGLGRCPRPGFI